MRINKEIRRISREMLRASFTNNRLDNGKIAMLVQTVLDKKPRYTVEILQHYRRLLRMEMNRHHARIESANPLNKETADTIAGRLKQKYGADLTTEFAVDPALLGGIRIRVGSDVWDGSVRNRLERLQQQL